MALAILAGLFLAVAGVLFPLAVLPGGVTTQATAQYLAGSQGASLLYVAAVLLSNLLFLPVLVLLTIRLYFKRPGTAIGAGVMIALAILLETIAVLVSLARWSSIPAAAGGDKTAISLFETIQALFLAIDLPGVLLFYAGAAIYALGLRRMHRPSAVILAVSIALLIAGGLLMAKSPAASTLLTAASIIVYGLGYMALGRLATILGR